jgi:elongation factor Ts
MMDCKKALAECECDIEKAVDWLRQKGLMTARKRAGRATREGLVVAGISPDMKTGAMVELNCETDFVAKNEGFQKLAADTVAMLLTSAAPSDLDALLNSKLASGETVDGALKALVGTIGENMNLRRFVAKKASDGAFLHTYIHGPGRMGVMVELAVEKMGAAAEELAHNIAMHIAASNPAALSEAEVPADMLEREKAIFKAKLAEQGKPEAMWEKIMVGQVKKFYSEVVLVHQAYVKDPDKSIADVLKAAEADCGKVEIKSFTRFQLGEELPGEESASEE